MLPVNFYRIIKNMENSNLKSNEKFEPDYIIKTINSILDYENTMLLCIDKDDSKNKESLKYVDEIVSKTVFKYALYEFLAPKRCLFEYKFNKKQFDEMVSEIIKSFNKSVVEPGEMIGVVAAQSMGEPLTQLTLNSFHSTGIGSAGTSTLGVPRIKELLGFSKNIKTPIMRIYLDKENRTDNNMANKITSYIRYTEIKDIRKRIDVYFDPYPFDKGGFMDKDNVYNVFYSHRQTKYSCQSDISNLPWIVRIELDREKMMDREVTILDIKSKFCNYWEGRYNNLKGIKKEERLILEKIVHCAVLSNTDNNKIPVIHIRFDMIDFNFSTVVSFTELFIDKFRLKGISKIDDIDNVIQRNMISFDNDDNKVEQNKEYLIITKGINMEDIRYINNIDFNRTTCNDVVYIYDTYGIEAARSSLLKEFKLVFEAGGDGINFQHLSVLIDIMTNNGGLTTIDRHGLNKTDSNPLARASFEKTVDQFINAAVFGEQDNMNSVSSRIMGGLVIKGGTGLCEIKLDTKMLENSEYVEDLDQVYDRTYTEISQDPMIKDIIDREEEEDDGVFMPV